MQVDAKTVKTVSGVIEAVLREGDKAVRRYTEEFDKVKLEGFRLTQNDIDKKLKLLDPEVRKLIDKNHDRITQFAQFQLSMYRDMKMPVDEGQTVLGHRIVPVDSAGIYIPGGRFPLLSSSLMGIIPARVAGVKRIVACTPPGEGRPHPAVLYGMVKAGATDIFTIGGAQAIAAMAIGTD